MKQVMMLILPLFCVLAFAGFCASQQTEATNNKVIICHYDRNEQGPNAGPHTIEVAEEAVEHHLLNHVKKEGYVGDDFIGPCEEDETPEATSTFTPTATETTEPGATATATRTVTPSATPTDTITNTPTKTITVTNTVTPIGTPTVTPSFTPTGETPTIGPSLTPRPTRTSIQQPTVTPILEPSITSTPFPTGDIDTPALNGPDTGSGGLKDCDSSSALLSWAVVGFLAGCVAIAMAWFSIQGEPPKKN